MLGIELGAFTCQSSALLLTYILSPRIIHSEHNKKKYVWSFLSIKRKIHIKSAFSVKILTFFFLLLSTIIYVFLQLKKSLLNTYYVPGAVLSVQDYSCKLNLQTMGKIWLKMYTYIHRCISYTSPWTIKVFNFEKMQFYKTWLAFVF